MGQFRKEDISFYKGRLQSEVANEIPKEEIIEEEVDVPISGTTEQLILYYTALFVATVETNKKRMYLNTMNALKELLEVKKQLRVYQLNEMMSQKEDSGTGEEYLLEDV